MSHAILTDRPDDWATEPNKRFLSMKMFRNLLLALIAFTVVAGSVVPANAAGRHHRGHHHGHRK
jgi:hypothetical protein